MFPERINMIIERNIETPTGNICIMTGEKGRLEFLSLGDYGQSNNVKADFLGLTDDINGVEHGALLPLEEKWVITISTQYGCSMGCTFCDVPKVGPGINATIHDLVGQFDLAMELHPEVKHGRINLHYARMGEPTWNPAVINSAYMIDCGMKEFKFHPVISTMMPRHNKELFKFLTDWLNYKLFHGGDAGLQLSINSTDDMAREVMFSDNAMTLECVSDMFSALLAVYDFKGRKIALNFALTGDEVDAKKLRQLFSPEHFMCKITPMHDTSACRNNGFKAEGYDTFEIYKPIEEKLKAEGFDVLVFVPSQEEDESRITCGNAILADK
jgi:23S rRNA (adenine2503-C2)-methyltransferase